MSKYKRTGQWTETEVQILTDIVKASFSRELAFRQASNKLLRSVSACQAKWYSLQSGKAVPSELATKATPAPAKAPASPVAPAKAAPASPFVIEDDWKPNKVYKTEVDSYLKSILETAEKLQPGQSFAVPFSILRSKYSWGTGASNSIRHLLKTNLETSVYGRLKIHETRGHNKELISIRIRRIAQA